MTKSELQLGLASLARHVMTLAAGALAAHGIAGGEQLEGIGASVAVFIATVGWSLIEKNKLIQQLCEAVPVSDLEDLGQMLVSLRSKSANPLLVANIANAVMAVAQQELLAAHPELAPAPVASAPPPPAQPPAPAPVSAPPPVEPSIAPEPVQTVEADQ